MRAADNGYLGNRRMVGEHVLDFGAVDVFAAGDDHVLDPVDDVDEALVVDPDKVTHTV
jgi:hypothetical protein